MLLVINNSNSNPYIKKFLRKSEKLKVGLKSKKNSRETI